MYSLLSRASGGVFQSKRKDVFTQTGITETTDDGLLLSRRSLPFLNYTVPSIRYNTVTLPDYHTNNYNTDKNISDAMLSNIFFFFHLRHTFY